MGNTTSNDKPYEITFHIKTNEIIAAYQTSSSSYDKDHPMKVDNSYYSISPANTDNPNLIDIGTSPSITITLVVHKNDTQGTLTLTQFIPTNNVSDGLVAKASGNVTDSMNLPVNKTAISPSETFDLGFRIDIGDEKYYCTLDPRLRANQGQN